jgi:hypothetical protein
VAPTGTWDEVRQRLAAQWPDRYGDDMTAEDFGQLMLLADTRVVVEEAAREKAAHREAEHPAGWSLASLRIALAESKPETCGLMTNGELAAVIRTEGIEARTIRTGKTTAKGIRKADVDRLMAAREDPQGVTHPDVTRNGTGRSLQGARPDYARGRRCRIAQVGHKGRPDPLSGALSPSIS